VDTDTGGNRGRGGGGGRFGAGGGDAGVGAFLGNDSVDGSEIRWEDDTGWDDARTHAINTWDALGRINIAPDNVTSIADLEWHSVNRSDVGFDGRWVPYFGADHIELNSYYLNGYTTTKRRGARAGPRPRARPQLQRAADGRQHAGPGEHHHTAEP
jgi:hypothetical protein